MDFIILLLGAGFVYLLYRIQKLETRLDAIDKPRTAETGKPLAKAKTVETPPPTVKQTKENSPVSRESKWELKMGAWVYTAIGSIALLLGLGFLLRFAIENNLISPAVRILLGVSLGAVLIGLGYWLETRMRQFAHILIGTGLGAWYLSLYAGSAVYGLVPDTIGFLLLCTVTCSGILLALRLNTQSLAAFALVGGFLTPFLLGSEQASPHAFFIYLIALNGVTLALAWFKPWRILPGLSFVGTVLTSSIWLAATGGNIHWSIPFAYFSILLVIFLARTITRILKGKLDSADYILACTNPIFFFAMMAGLHPESIEGRYWAAGIALLIALVHLALAAWRERVLFIGLGSMFLALAAPLYVEQSKWFLLAWTMEALTLGILADKLKSKKLDLLSHALFGIAAVGLINALGTAAGRMPWLNQRMLLWVIAIGAYTIMAWYDERKRMHEPGAKRTWLSTAHLVVTYALTLVAVLSEISVFYQPDQDLWMSTAAVVLGSLAVMGGLWIGSFAMRLSGVITIAFAGLTVIIDAAGRNPDQILQSPRVLALLICASIVGAIRVYLRTADSGLGKDEASFLKPAAWLTANAFLLTLVSAETLDGIRIYGGTSDHAQVALSIAWLVYGIALVVYGIVRKSKISRGTALAIFLLVIAKVLMIDTAELDNFARFITFISLGGVLMISGFLYNRFKARIE